MTENREPTGIEVANTDGVIFWYIIKKKKVVVKLESLGESFANDAILAAMLHGHEVCGFDREDGAAVGIETLKAMFGEDFHPVLDETFRDIEVIAVEKLRSAGGV